MNNPATEIQIKTGEERYLSPAYLRHIILDFIQMKEFIQEPLVFNRGDGIWVWDVRGDQYLDGISGVWVVNFGHNNQRIINAIKEQLERLSFCSPILSTNSRALELADLLGRITPAGLTTIKLLSGGSEATETAIKLARQYFQQTGRPNKKTIISRYLNFHGVTLGALSATGIASRKWMFEPLCGGFRHIAPPYCLRCPYGLTYPGCDILCARILEQIIQYEDPSTVAAFMADPIQLSTGNIVPPPEYFPIIRHICDKYDVMLIFDEIVTGCGRTGKMWGADTFNTVPDILCVGKGLSGGYAPLAGVAFRDDVAEVFFGDDHRLAFADGHTYGGNPIASAAGVAAIQELLERNLVERVAKMGCYLMSRLQELRDLEPVIDVRGAGLMVGIEFAQDRATRAPFPPAIGFGVRVGRNCIYKQRMLTRYAPNWVAIAPPFIVTEEEIDMMVQRLRRAIQDVIQEVRAE